MLYNTTMTKKVLPLLLTILTLAPACLNAASWLENDYAFGSNGSKKESLSFFSNVSTRVAAGINASFHKDRGLYRSRVYSLRLPLMYSGNNFFVSLKPFLYPSSSDIRSSARGAKLSLLLPVNQEDENGYMHLIFSGAAAEQKTFLRLAGGPEHKRFSQASFELQMEKSYYDQFFFLASAAGFSKPDKTSGRNLINPALDHGDMAYMGVFRTVTALPEWVAAVQIARSMEPDYSSHIYAGFGRISFRNSDKVNSLLTGIRVKLNGRSSMDLGYNFYKMNGEAAKNYYKLSVQLFF